jgi:hypothetical protein
MIICKGKTVAYMDYLEFNMPSSSLSYVSPLEHSVTLCY